MCGLPRQLSVDELAELFGGHSAFVDRLAELDDPLGRAPWEAMKLTDEERLEAIALHPRIGEGSPEQHGDEPEVFAELAELNRAYEAKFGFRFIVFVAGRSRAALVPVLRERLQRTREVELERAVDELCAIAQDRWFRR